MEVFVTRHEARRAGRWQIRKRGTARNGAAVSQPPDGRGGQRPSVLSPLPCCLARPQFCEYSRPMYDFPLTGAQKSHLRGLGQKIDATLKIGKGGLTPAFFVELNKILRAHELVKLRFLGAERDEREVLSAQIADDGRCVCVGGVGHTALFYRQNPDPTARTVVLP